MFARRTVTTYALLAAALIIIVVLQVFEHSRINDNARAAMLNRAHDISNSLGVVIRSQGRFGGLVPQPRIEAALTELTKSNELKSVALLNSAREITASAGNAIDADIDELIDKEMLWGDKVISVVNLVDLGSETEEGGQRRPTIVMPTPPESEDGEKPPAKGAPSSADASVTPDEERKRPPRGPDREGRGEGGGGGRGQGGGRGRRPFWLNEERYAELIEKQGVHYFVLVMSTEAFLSEITRDMWLRIIVSGIALVAVAGLGVGWHYLERSAGLQMRLLRASEMNTHLREMNVAAAGLAHETRNPLNIIRGLSQLISALPEAGEEIKKRAGEISEEVDRVTGRLNQFIDYSKPPDARPAPTNLMAVVHDVIRALETDAEDKELSINAKGPDLTVEADESLLRQVIFNLLLNSIQAVKNGGEIEVLVERNGKGDVSFDVRDNGPGVAPENHEEIFRPYVTTSENGTGLGLAVVRQIVLAHQWEIAYADRSDGGACFRVTGLRVS